MFVTETHDLAEIDKSVNDLSLSSYIINSSLISSSDASVSHTASAASLRSDCFGTEQSKGTESFKTDGSFDEKDDLKTS